MDALIAVPLKKTYEVDLIKPLRTFIQNTFTGISQDEYNPSLAEFNKLRGEILSKSSTVEKHESALELFYRFVCFLF